MYICTVTLEQHLHQNTFTSPQHRLQFHILVVARQFDVLARRILKPHAISAPQYNVLRILRGQKGQPIAIHALAERMIDPASNTSRIVDKLAEKGWATRTACPKDRRRADVVICEEGLALLTGLDEPINRLFTSCFADFSATETEELNDQLAKVLQATDTVLNQPFPSS